MKNIRKALENPLSGKDANRLYKINSLMNLQELEEIIVVLRFEQMVIFRHLKGRDSTVDQTKDV
jgi:hypothetical protein